MVDRTNLVKSALNGFANKDLKSLRQRFTIVFQNEWGSDAGGYLARVKNKFDRWFNKRVFDYYNKRTI